MEGMHGKGEMKGMGVRGVGTHKPKLCLTNLVQKLDLLTGDVGITLSAEQAAAVSNHLKDIEMLATMSDSDAKKTRNLLVALLDAKQKARLNAIELPPPEVSTGSASNQQKDQNPFQQDAEGKSLKSLRDRLAAKGTAPKAEAPKSETPKIPPAKMEPTKATPPKADALKSQAAKQ